MNCPKCMNKYNFKKNLPRILPNCGHTFCEECLHGLIINNENKSKSIMCPLCNANTQIDDVSSLTKNIVLLESSLTTINTNISTTINSLNETNLSIVKRSSKILCNIHSKDLEAFCETDKMMLCVSCILENDHKNHDLSSIDKSSQKERAVIETGYDKILEIETKLNNTLQKITEYKEYMMSKVQNGLVTNRQFFSEIIRMVEERESQIEERIKKCMNEEVENLNMYTETIHSRVHLINKFKEFKNGIDNLSEFEILQKSKENLKLIKDLSKNISINVNLNIKEDKEFCFIDLNKEEEISIIKKDLRKLVVKSKTSNSDNMMNVHQQIANVQAKLNKIDHKKEEKNEIEKDKIKADNEDMVNVQQQIANVKAKLDKIDNKIEEKNEKEKNKIDNQNNILSSVNVQVSLNNNIQIQSSQSTPCNTIKNSKIITEKTTNSEDNINNIQNFTKAAKNKKKLNNLITIKSSKNIIANSSVNLSELNSSNIVSESFNFVKKEADVEQCNGNRGAKRLALFPAFKMKNSNDKFKNCFVEKEIKNEVDLAQPMSSAYICEINLDENIISIEKVDNNEKPIESADLDNNPIAQNNIESNYNLNFSDEFENDTVNLDFNTNENEVCHIENALNNKTPTEFITSENNKLILHDQRNSLQLSSSKMFHQDMASLYMSSNNYILLLGGKAEISSRRYCVDSDNWDSYDISVERSDFIAVNYKDKKVLILGGRVTNSQGIETITDAIDLLNTKEKTIKRLEIKMKHPRINFGCVYFNNRLYIAGGFNGKDVLNNFEFFEKRNRIWSDLPKMQIKRKEFGMVIGPDNCIYAIGGSDDKEMVLKSVEKFDIEKNCWIKIDDMNQKRKGCSVVCMPDGLYALGGYDGCQYLKSVEKFDLSIRKWKYAQDMNYSRCFASSVNSFDFQYIYTQGGYDGKPLSNVERYDVLSGEWEILKRMPAARYRHQSLFLSE